MKKEHTVLKKLIIGLVVIVVVFVGVGFVLPSTYSVERSVVIDAKPEVIFHQVNTLERWESWTPWSLEAARSSVRGGGSVGAAAGGPRVTDPPQLQLYNIVRGTCQPGNPP